MPLKVIQRHRSKARIRLPVSD